MRTFIIAVCFVAGLNLAASEGQYWPWVNLFGIGIFAMVPLLARGIKE